MIYGIIIKHIRNNRGMSQRQLAKKLGVEQSYISVVENGKMQPSRDFIENFCYETEVPIMALMFFSTTDNDVPENNKKNLEYLNPTLKTIFEKFL